MIEMTDDEYLQLVQASRKQRGGLFWALFAVALLMMLVLLTLDHFGKLPPALVDRIAGAPQVQFSTPQNTSGAAPQMPVAAPEGQAAPQPRSTPFYGAPEMATAAPTNLPEPTPVPALAPAPDDNPGFTCGVEPGMDPNADCQDTQPDAIEVESAAIPKQGPRKPHERVSEKAAPDGH